jgi:peroxiredoxin Q/BCP
MAYGAAADAKARTAARVGVIIGPDGKVKQWFPKVNAAAFPQEALQLI